MARLSVAILTKNESQRILACIRSASFADEMIVVDSGSSDNTVELAKSAGALVFVYPDWQGFALQRNRLLSHCTGDYVLMLDADEQISPLLQESIKQVLLSDQTVIGKMKWLTVAFEKPLKHFNQGAVERLYPRTRLSHFEGVVHEKAVLINPADSLPKVLLSGDLLHFSRTSVKDSIEKLKQYALLGAAKRATQGKQGGVLRGLASGMAIFIRQYFFKLGFLSGGAGFLFCFFIALESFFRYAALEYDKDLLRNDATRN